ncbi:NAD-dependent epimerase/dehydratase family protein [Chlorobium sp. KB01]|uniref:NAD-dependent epimerase/dehydratase family protein n=1 Tax=Chlorobium sp. KB01 TaxID=1917528 RepID=UPI000976BFA0|nr:NAD-dependent epimerase/dehydratase family protein [Chlorobium sp. KB01]
MPNSSIVITGGTGYIGSQILLALLSRFSGQLSIRVIARQSSDCSFLESLPVDVVRADILDPLALNEALRGADTVFHCAGLISYTGNFRNALYENNVVGTRNVVNACILNNVRRLVLTSSIAAVGSTEDGSPASELTTFQEWQRRNGYMEAKHLAELEGLRGVAEGLDVVLVNPGVVIGVDQNNSASLSSSNEVLRLIYQGRLPLCPSGGTGFVDVRDVADAHIAAWQKGRTGERYLVVGHNLLFRELFDRIGSLAGSSMGPVFMVPDTFGFLAGLGGEIWSIVTNSPSFISLESIRISSRPLSYSNSRSVQELTLRYRELSETLMTIVT